MATLKPFRALRPNPAQAAGICTLPYDVMSTEEARAMAQDKPLSFLRVTRPELEMGDDADPHSPEVYQRGAENLRALIEHGALVREEQPIYILYRLVMGEHTQLGIMALASCAEYDAGLVKKHELTRPDKEDDRTTHIKILGAQTGLVFLTYAARPEIDALLEAECERDPDIDLTAEDGIRHSAWFVRDAAALAAIENAFAKVPALYVADGHHRSAAASRVARERAEANPNHRGDEPYNFFITVTFPHDQVQILAYNRVVKDLNGLTPEAFLAKLAEVADLDPVGPVPTLKSKGELAIFIQGQWRRLRWKPSVLAAAKGAVEALDVSLLQDNVLAPLLAIGDPRTDKRISFIGGIRGTDELQRLVESGEYAVAFAMYPTALEDLMTIADEGGLMPPKSTWFEPKLRDAMAVHLID
ncbi:MAG: hypothetical protein PWP23_1837 [Candidatus Sumerlaeota bacterium]|nr:hypothetical protein [Candidatus Sumerlaeota bacterium]